MSLTILFMLLFSLLLLFSDYRNKYYLLFILMMLGMSMAMMTLLSDISKSSNYLVPGNYLYASLEIRIYRLINAMFHIPISVVAQIRNMGIVIYLETVFMFVYSFHNTIRHDGSHQRTRKKIMLYSALALYPVAFALFYHPETAYQIYHAYHTAKAPGIRQALSIAIKTLDITLTALALVQLSYPVFYLVHNYLKNRVTFFSEQLKSLAASLALLNLSFFCMFFTGEFRPSVESVFESGLWRYRLSTQIPIFFTAYLPVLTLMVLSVIFFILIRFKTHYLMDGFKARGIQKNLNTLYANVRNIMHNKKNLVFNIRILAQSALENSEDPKAQEKLNQIIDICETNLSEISKLLDNACNPSLRLSAHNFIDAVETALQEQSIPPNVTIEKQYQPEELPLNFDLYQMTEAIGNILGNALEALAASDVERPRIVLTVYASNSWVYFSVTDNGCGIPKKLIKKVFRPYVSTKSKKNSWGIGLSYVFNVVKAHYGHIRIRSQEKAYTSVEFLLPRNRLRR